MDVRFKCTQCGRCCRDTRIPLTVAEAIEWLCRGHEVQLLCEASPWSAALDDDPRAQHFKRRSFAVTSGSMPARVVVMLVANAVGACPNLLSDLRCGIYEERPLVCRIYPAEINPFVTLDRDQKACPPEAWNADRPLLQREGVLIDEVIRRDVEASRAADAFEPHLKSRLCVALNIADTALVHEAMLAYSPPENILLSALAFVISTASGEEPTAHWRFVSSQAATLEALVKSGGIASSVRDADTGAFQYLGCKREPIFAFDPAGESAARHTRIL